MVQLIFTIIISFPLLLNADSKQLSAVNHQTPLDKKLSLAEENNQLSIYLKLATLEILISNMEMAQLVETSLSNSQGEEFSLQLPLTIASSSIQAGMLYGFERVIQFLTPEQTQWLLRYRELKLKDLELTNSIAYKTKVISQIDRNFGPTVAHRKDHFVAEESAKLNKNNDLLRSHLSHKFPFTQRFARGAARTTGIALGGTILMVTTYENLTFINMKRSQFEEKLQSLKTQRSEIQELLFTEISSSIN